MWNEGNSSDDDGEKKWDFSADMMSVGRGDWLNVEDEEKRVSLAWIVRFIYSAKSSDYPLILFIISTLLLLFLLLMTLVRHRAGPGNIMKHQTWYLL